MSEDRSTRKSPPETEDDWEYLWRGARHGHAMWPVIGPFIAVARNWKAGFAVVLVVLWLNGHDTLDAFKRLLGLP